MNSDLDGRIMNKFVALRTKIYSYITDEGHSGKKVKRQKDLCKKNQKKKQEIELERCKIFLEQQNNAENTGKYRSKAHSVSTKKTDNYGHVSKR